jgi:hypothetical protein
MTPAERTSEWLRNQMKSSSEQMFSLGLRILSWLLLGNAAALVLLLKATLEGTTCDRPTLVKAAWFFVGGLTCAFIGAAATYLMNLWSLGLLGKIAGAIDVVATNEFYITKLEAEGIAVLDDAPLRQGIDRAAETMKDHERSLARLWSAFWLIVLIYLASAAAFAAGVISPLISGVAAKTC